MLADARCSTGSRCHARAGPSPIADRGLRGAPRAVGEPAPGVPARARADRRRSTGRRRLLRSTPGVVPPRPSAARRRLGALRLAGVARDARQSGRLHQHRAYLSRAAQTPVLEYVGDEWRGIDAVLRARWSCLRASSSGSCSGSSCSPRSRYGLIARCAARATADPPSALDPALAALSGVRGGRADRGHAPRVAGDLPAAARRTGVGTARARSTRAGRDAPARRRCAAFAVLAGFVWNGPWARISMNVPRTWSEYGRPYATWDYFADAIWLIRDAGLQGRLYASYKTGGFAGFWLAPAGHARSSTAR